MTTPTSTPFLFQAFSQNEFAQQLAYRILKTLGTSDALTLDDLEHLTGEAQHFLTTFAGQQAVQETVKIIEELHPQDLQLTPHGV